VSNGCRPKAGRASAAAFCRFSAGQVAGRRELAILSCAARASSLKESGSKLPHSRAPAAQFPRVAEVMVDWHAADGWPCENLSVLRAPQD